MSVDPDLSFSLSHISPFYEFGGSAARRAKPAVLVPRTCRWGNQYIFSFCSSLLFILLSVTQIPSIRLIRLTSWRINCSAVLMEERRREGCHVSLERGGNCEVFPLLSLLCNCSALSGQTLRETLQLFMREGETERRLCQVE
jgi:hypothetical protein